ncbi:MAG: DUF4440 domain-containing protein [Cyclobacteriaceae bacterium]|nr:DUF4440 domain-containing protein [Cyclobacteriaceae bacterium]
MKLLFVCISLLASVAARAQTPQAEINKQVWLPFVAAFNNNQTDAFMALHTKDAIRAPRDGKVVWNWDEYYKAQSEGDQQDKKENRKRTLALRFSERISNHNLAVEVGIYKTSYVLADGNTQDFYGRFHVVLRKEKGTWKILVDTDSSEGGHISEKDFLAAQPWE